MYIVAINSIPATIMRHSWKSSDFTPDATLWPENDISRHFFTFHFGFLPDGCCLLSSQPYAAFYWKGHHWISCRCLTTHCPDLCKSFLNF